MGGGDINDPFTPELSEFVNKTIDEWKVAGIAIGVIDGDDVFTKVDENNNWKVNSLTNAE